MDELSIWLVGATALVAITAGLHFVARGAAKARAEVKARFGAALRQLCEEIGLEYEHLPETWDRARGDVGRCTVNVHYDSVEITEERSEPWLRLQVYGRNLPDEMVLRRPGAKLHREGDVRAPQKTGDAAFDAAVEVSGASREILRALAERPALRALVVKVVSERGATLVSSNLSHAQRDFPERVEALRELLMPMIELVAWLGRPDRREPPPVVGTPAALALRGLDDLGGEARMAVLTRFFDALGPRLGEGRSYPDPGENDFRWQGPRLRITVSWSESVEIDMKTDAALELDLSYEPDVDEGARAPAWDEDDADAKVFLAPHVHAPRGRSFERLPEALRRVVAESMPADEIRHLRFEQRRAYVLFWPDLHEMSDPEGQILRTVALLRRIAAEALPAAGE